MQWDKDVRKVRTGQKIINEKGGKERRKDEEKEERGRTKGKKEERKERRNEKKIL